MGVEEEIVNKYIRQTSRDISARKGRATKEDSHLTGYVFLHMSISTHSFLQPSIDIDSRPVVCLARSWRLKYKKKTLLFPSMRYRLMGGVTDDTEGLELEQRCSWSSGSQRRK